MFFEGVEGVRYVRVNEKRLEITCGNGKLESKEKKKRKETIIVM